MKVIPSGLKILTLFILFQWCLFNTALASDRLIMTGENNSTNVDVVDATNLTFTVVDSMTATSDFGGMRGIFGMSLHPFTQEKCVVYQPLAASSNDRRLGIIDQTTASSGEYDYLLKIITHDMNSYNRLVHEKILRLPSIRSVNTSFSMQQKKRTSQLPIGD